jgi:3-polyprenyl-4-hydroxybenzoate decarboxylase
VIVVDEDIDPTSNMDILWAMATRCDCAEDIDIIRRAWSGPLDPRKAKTANFNSRAIVVACKPFETMADFPPTVGSSPALHDKIAAKWGHLLKKK